VRCAVGEAEFARKDGEAWWFEVGTWKNRKKSQDVVA
jgi:hypothetical protein